MELHRIRGTPGPRFYERARTQLTIRIFMEQHWYSLRHLISNQHVHTFGYMVDGHFNFSTTNFVLLPGQPR